LNEGQTFDYRFPGVAIETELEENAKIFGFKMGQKGDSKNVLPIC
jgi:hypothetical protein